MEITSASMSEDKVSFLTFHMSSILNREDFILNSDSGKFIVKKDELLVGNVRMVHRDERIFDQPHKFLPARFENKVKFYSSLRFEE